MAWLHRPPTKSSLTAASVIAIQTSRTSVAEDLVAPAERGWSSAPRARSRSVGCAILSESLRPPLADQLVDQFALASIVSERAAQLLGCGAALCGRGVGRVRRPGHGLIVAGGGPASRRSRTRPLVSCCVPSLRALPLDEARELRIRPGRWRSLAPGKESVAKRSLACLAAMLQLGVLGGFPQVAREAADVPGGGRVRVAGENTMLRDGELRSFAPGARVLVIGQDVEKLAPGGLGGPLGPGSVDVGRVVIGTGSAALLGARVWAIARFLAVRRAIGCAVFLKCPGLVGAPRPSTSASGQRAEGEGRRGPPETHAARGARRP